jgi:hypothetical protein
MFFWHLPRVLVKAIFTQLDYGQNFKTIRFMKTLLRLLAIKEEFLRARRRRNDMGNT